MQIINRYTYIFMNYLSIRQLKVADGEMFTDTDIKAASKVCILGQTVVDYLFPDGSDPIGKVVRFNSIPFRVIGVLKKKGYNSMGMDQDDLVLAPYTLVIAQSELLLPYSHPNRALEHYYEFCSLYIYWRFLWMVSCKEGSSARPYRGYQIRIKKWGEH